MYFIWVGFFWAVLLVLTLLAVYAILAVVDVFAVLAIWVGLTAVVVSAELAELLY